jgi:hypothetical protein
MPEINICNSAERDAVVNMESVSQPLRVRWIDSKSRQASSVRVLKSTLAHDYESLKAEFGEDIGQSIIDGDPEVNMELVGTVLQATSRVFVDKEQKLVHRIQQFELVLDPDGNQTERRPKQVVPQNVSNELPLRWTGKFIDKDEAVRKFVFVNKMQLTHINGLTYDFLYGMAKELHEKKSMMLLGGGPKSNQPLILRRGSNPFRGFLEGRIDGDRYCLVLHLSNLELKVPEEKKEETEA